MAIAFADLLQREGLDPRRRHLVAATAAIGPAAWERFDEVAASARNRGVPRGDLEETLFQATLFFGFPRAVTAYERLANVWPAPRPPIGGSLPPAEQPAAGRALFAAIYGKHDEAVRAQLRSFHADFHDFVLDAAYGRVLARPGLSPETRELLAAGALAVLEQKPQLVAHARGALAFGASRGELREALVTALGDEAAADELLRRV